MILRGILRIVSYVHSVHPPFLQGWGGGWASNQIFEKGRLTGPQLLEGGCWERGGVTFFRGGLQFSLKK